jgi:hypothetical protein
VDKKLTWEKDEAGGYRARECATGLLTGIGVEKQVGGWVVYAPHWVGLSWRFKYKTLTAAKAAAERRWRPEP